MMLDRIDAALNAILHAMWNWPMIVLLLGTGIYLTIRLRLIQASGIFHAVDLLTGRYDNREDAGAITHFQALSAALSGTIGLGNIAGVAFAMSKGGPGALFWMWITALFGMAIKYASCMLGLKFRKVHEDGRISGGPMYYIEYGLGKKYKPLAYAFALFAIISSFGAANMLQSHEAAATLNNTFGVPEILTGLVIAFFVFLVIIGGIKRIGKVASRLVPLMCVIYVLGACAIIILKAENIPYAFGLIFRGAFCGTAVAGGMIGYTIKMALEHGVRRALQSNEAGQGSAPMAHAAARTTEPVREGLVAMIGPFIDTIVVCTMTGLVLICSGTFDNPVIWGEGGRLVYEGAEITAMAFGSVLTFKGIPVGEYIVIASIVLFAYSTLLTWSYYGEQCAEYLFQSKRAVLPYKAVFVVFVVIGSVWKLDAIFSFSDVANGLMAAPNLVALFGLSGLVVKMTKDYIGRLRERDPSVRRLR
ncbi:alanine/glycine:cation symporter family protein [Thermodesulfobacteriota bacterium]